MRGAFVCYDAPAMRIVPAALFVLGLAACDRGGARDALAGPDGAASGDADASDAATNPDSAVGPDAARLVADPGPPRAVDVGAEIVLDASGSIGAVLYQWDLGEAASAGVAKVPTTDPIARATYRSPGRHQPRLSVFDAAGRRQTATLQVTATHPPLRIAPSNSSTLAVRSASDGGLWVGVVVPDADLLVILHRGPTQSGPRGAETAAFEVVARHAVGDEPRSVTATGDGFAVACRGADVIEFVSVEAASDAPHTRIALPRGARPFGVVGRAGQSNLYVTLSARGSVARVPLNGSPLVEVFGFPDARGLAWVADDVVLVSRWRSRDGRGLLWRLETRANDLHDVPLDFDPQASPPPDAPPPDAPPPDAPPPDAPEDASIGGVPNVLDVLAVAPHGLELAVPSLLANVGGGLFREGRPLTPSRTVRAVVSFVALGADEAAEVIGRRVQLPRSGFANAAVYSSRGEFLYVSAPGAQVIERLDLLAEPSADPRAGTLVEVGHDIRGLALTPDDRFLLVDVSLDRTLAVYDVGGFEDEPEALPVARIPLLQPSGEPLSPAVLRGKVLFHDAADPRLSVHGYIACAHCHPDGEDDGLTWDFTDRGEGLRNTLSLIGRASASEAQGPLHWSANFDEVQDFEHDLRANFGGTGLLPDAVFHADGRDTPLGTRKAGAGADLDALAAYVGSLAAWPKSPHRTPEGGLPEAALWGRELFASPETGCLECHHGAALTDSAFVEEPGVTPRVPLLHDVGTLGPGSGKRLGGPLLGLDTPTLHGLWDSAPYLHDGAVSTLRALFAPRDGGNPEDRHGRTSQLSPQELDALVMYLKCLDGGEDPGVP